MSDDLFGAPAGWYPDPLGLPQLRWWNNHAWTEQTSAARQPMVVQDTKFAWADDELPSRREERERERSAADRTPTETAAPTADTLRELEPPRAFTQVNSGAPTAPAAPAAPAAAPAAATAAAPPAPAAAASAAFESLFASAPVAPAAPAAPSLSTIFDAKPAASAPAEALDALFGTKSSTSVGTRVKTPIVTVDQVAVTATRIASLPANTGPAWLIAMVPLVQLVITLLVITSLGMRAPTLLYVMILVVPDLLVIGLAIIDHRMLKQAGYERPAHWAWAVLTAPVYLLARARAVIRETGHGLGPVIVWFALGFVHLASIIAIPGLLIALLPAVFSSQIEQNVAEQAIIITGSQMVVDCPPTPPLIQGEQVVCRASSGGGNKLNVTITQTRANGWIAWQVLDWGVFSKAES